MKMSWALGLGMGLLLAVAPSCSEDAGGPSEAEGGDAGAGAASGDAGAASNDAGAASNDAGAGSASVIAGMGGEGAATAMGGGGAGQGGVGGSAEVAGLDCNGDPLHLDPERVRDCVMLNSCANRSDWYRTSDCVANGTDAFAFQMSEGELDSPTLLDGRALTCGALHSCDDVYACLGERKVVDECDDQISRCSANQAISCDRGGARVQDCTKLGGTCQVFGTGTQAHAECVVVAECEAPFNRDRCEGNKLYRCAEAGPGFGMDCGQFGLSCVETRGGASCHEPLPTVSCEEPGTAACDGSVLRFCSSDGVSFDRDCSVAGDLVCVEGSGDRPEDYPFFDCSAKGCGVRFEPTDQCDGDTLLLDLGYGQHAERVPVHCPDYGFATCNDGACTHDMPPQGAGGSGAGGAAN